MGQCVVFSTVDKAVVLTVLQTAHSVSFGKLLTFHKLFNLSFLFKFPTCWKVLKTITMFPQSSC